LGGGSEPPPHQLGVEGERCKLPEYGVNFGAFWDLRNHVRTVS